MTRLRHNLEQRVSIYDSYVKTDSYKSCRRKFCHKMSDITCPSGDTISKLVKKCNICLNSHIPYWVQHTACRPLLAYCTCPGWLWGWRIWWNEDWQGKPKYSEKTCLSATLSTTNPTWPDPGANPGCRSLRLVTDRLSKLMKKIRIHGILIDRKPLKRNRCFNWGKTYDIGHRLENSPQKSLWRLARQSGVYVGTAWTAIKHVDYKERVRFCNWFINHVHDGLLDPKLIFFSGYVNSQNNRYWSNETHGH
jgi:hypothetical protein